MRGVYRFSKSEPGGRQSLGVTPKAVASANEFLSGAVRPRLEAPDPPMQPRDEFIFYLSTAAEIEHSLMVQYLYVAYSLDAEDETQATWRETILEIAREEMGHLMSIQNLLHAVGGPLRFDREDYPFNLFYPFPFKLEPFSLEAIARYVLAEMPDSRAIDPALGFDFDAVKRDAGVAEAGEIANRVGLLYARMLEQLTQLTQADFDAGTAPWQAPANDWTFGRMIVRRVTTPAEAQALIAEIGEQGEGSQAGDDDNSHFVKFFRIYQAIQANPAAAIASDVPINPEVQDEQAPGYFTDAASRAWGALFNTRYRVLLAEFAHLLVLRRDPAAGDATGEPLRRRKLTQWALTEMPVLAQIADLLVARNQHDPPQSVSGRPRRAAPPFTLPYILDLPTFERHRWQSHKSLVNETSARIQAIRDAGADDDLLEGLEESESERLEFINEQLEAPEGTPGEPD